MEIGCPHCQGQIDVPQADPEPAGEESGAEVAATGEGGALPPQRRGGALPKGGAAELAQSFPQGGGREIVAGGHVTPAADDGAILAALARGEMGAFAARREGSHVVFGCPFCSRPVEIKLKQQGEEVRCVECSGMINAPDLATDVSASPISGSGGVAGAGAVSLPARRQEAPLRDDGEIPHRLNEEKETKFVPRDKAEAGFDLETAWMSYSDEKPMARFWARRLKRLSVVAMLAVMLAALAASIVWINRSERTADGAAAAATAEETSPAQRAMAVIEGFSRAATVIDRLPYVRDAERAKSRMRRFYGRVGSDAPMPPLDASSYQEFDKAGLRFASIQSVSGTSGRKLWLEISANGGLALDWESAVGYGEYDIVSFESVPPPRSVAMRVLVRPSDYYNYEFSDANSLVSYQLTDLAGRAEIYGYAIRGGAVAVELEKLHPIGAAAGASAYINCTLILRSGAQGGRKGPAQLWIDGVVAIGWLVP